MTYPQHKVAPFGSEKNQLHKIYRSKNVAQAMLKQLQSNNSTKFKNAYTSSIEISEIKEEYK